MFPRNHIYPLLFALVRKNGGLLRILAIFLLILVIGKWNRMGNRNHRVDYYKRTLFEIYSVTLAPGSSAKLTSNFCWLYGTMPTTHTKPLKVQLKDPRGLNKLLFVFNFNESTFKNFHRSLTLKWIGEKLQKANKKFHYNKKCVRKYLIYMFLFPHYHDLTRSGSLLHWSYL